MSVQEAMFDFDDKFEVGEIDLVSMMTQTFTNRPNIFTIYFTYFEQFYCI